MELAWAQAELAGAQVWDHRCRQSLQRICERLANWPLTSFSAACGPALRQAAHRAPRIFAHHTTSVAGLLEGHFTQTQHRAAPLLAEEAIPSVFPYILVVQDTTVINYSSHLATLDLGPIGNTVDERGLLAHAALALPPEGAPLGLIHLSIGARDAALHGRCRDSNTARARPAEDKESRKWLEGLRGTEAALGEVPFLLIQDREGAVFDFLLAPREPNAELLIRAATPRKILLQSPTAGMSLTRQRAVSCTLWEGLATTPVCGTMQVSIPRSPGRKARSAELELRVLEAWIIPPRGRKATPESRQQQAVQVWVVQAQESTPPPETPPVCWVLRSTLSVTSAAAAAQMVRSYSRRWLIEQLHLVLKSGLRIERLQFDAATSLKHALAVCYLVAWRVLYLRDVARFLPEAPAEEVVTPLERQVLETREQAALPTARAIVRAGAHLAGFPRYPSAGEPG